MDIVKSGYKEEENREDVARVPPVRRPPMRLRPSTTAGPESPQGLDSESNERNLLRIIRSSSGRGMAHSLEVSALPSSVAVTDVRGNVEYHNTQDIVLVACSPFYASQLSMMRKPTERDQNIGPCIMVFNMNLFNLRPLASAIVSGPDS